MVKEREKYILICRETEHYFEHLETILGVYDSYTAAQKKMQESIKNWKKETGIKRAKEKGELFYYAGNEEYGKQWQMLYWRHYEQKK
jgi:hypothetical protein